MKTINFLTSHFIPENTACTNRVLAFVRELAKNYKINVICLTQKGEVQEHTKVSYSDKIDIYYVNQKELRPINTKYAESLWNLMLNAEMILKSYH